MTSDSSNPPPSTPAPLPPTAALVTQRKAKSPLLWPFLAIIGLLVVNLLLARIPEPVQAATTVSAAPATPEPSTFIGCVLEGKFSRAGVALHEAFTEGFFRIEIKDGHLFGSLIDILRNGAPVMLLALGMTLVIATGGIDLSVGAVMAIAGAVAGSLIAPPEGSLLAGVHVHGSVMAIVGLSLLFALAAGLWNGVLVAIVDIQPIVATLILMVAGRGVAELITNGQHAEFQNMSPGFYFLGGGPMPGGGYILGLPFPILFVPVVFVVMLLFTRATALGLFLESVGDNAIASRNSGINAVLVKLIAYVVCGLTAGLAGLIQTANVQTANASTTGLYMELDAILAVAIGGTGLNGGRFSLAGSLLGALLMQTLTTTILTQGVDPPKILMVKAIVVIGVCLFQSEQFRGLMVNARSMVLGGKQK